MVSQKPTRTYTPNLRRQSTDVRPSLLNIEEIYLREHTTQAREGRESGKERRVDRE